MPAMLVISGYRNVDRNMCKILILSEDTYLMHFYLLLSIFMDNYLDYEHLCGSEIVNLFF